MVRSADPGLKQFSEQGIRVNAQLRRVSGHPGDAPSGDMVPPDIDRTAEGQHSAPTPGVI